MRESLTKYPLRPDELETLVGKAFGPDRSAAHWSEIAGGTYNAVFAVTLDDGRDLVLKVAPRPDLRLLTHEVDLMRTEVDVYRRCAEAGVAAPAVVHADFDRDVIVSDYVFLTRVNGVGLDGVRDSMTPQDLASVRGQVSSATASLNRVTGNAFGYPLRGSRSWQPTWRAAFGAMVDDILDDATRLGSALPLPPERIGDILRRHADALDEVRRPALVHFDLWDGNVFVSPDPALGWRLEGLIDGERAFYGDPVAELVSLGLFRDLDEATLEPFGVLTDQALLRLDLYNAYLYVIMAIEGATRGWTSPETLQREAWLRDKLDAILVDLGPGRASRSPTTRPSPRSTGP